ncbi:MAG: hypothetical protein H0V23_10720 [Nocardioidaceae bacterium]|nr:hypothetical protein [Nocardioidaceae bacterium]
MPIGVEGDLGNIVEDDVVSAGLEKAKPPRLVPGALGQVMHDGAFLDADWGGFIVDLMEGGVRLEYRRDRRCDGPVDGGGIGDPGNVARCTDPPASSIFGDLHFRSSCSDPVIDDGGSFPSAPAEPLSRVATDELPASDRSIT